MFKKIFNDITLLNCHFNISNNKYKTMYQFGKGSSNYMTACFEILFTDEASLCHLSGLKAIF